MSDSAVHAARIDDPDLVAGLAAPIRDVESVPALGDARVDHEVALTVRRDDIDAEKRLERDAVEPARRAGPPGLSPRRRGFCLALIPASRETAPDAVVPCCSG